MLPYAMFVVCTIFLNAGHVFCNDECNEKEVKECFVDLVSYEVFHFPFYGGNAKELDETCRKMEYSFECVQKFLTDCEQNPKCEDVCKETKPRIESFMKGSGLPILYEKLCENAPGDTFFKEYIKHYECLEKADKKYEVCRNMSQASNEFQVEHKFNDVNEIKEARCCYFNWYEDCFTNATMKTCGANATFFMSRAVHIHLGAGANMDCTQHQRCPLPPMGDNKKLHGKETSSRGSSLEINLASLPVCLTISVVIGQMVWQK